MSWYPHPQVLDVEKRRKHLAEVSELYNNRQFEEDEEEGEEFDEMGTPGGGSDHQHRHHTKQQLQPQQQQQQQMKQKHHRRMVKGFSFAPPTPVGEGTKTRNPTHSHKGNAGSTSGPKQWFQPDIRPSERTTTRLLVKAAKQGKPVGAVVATAVEAYDGSASDGGMGGMGGSGVKRDGSVGLRGGNVSSSETLKQRVNRMSTQQVDAHKARVRELDAKIYNNPEVYSYKPPMDTISRKVGRTSTLKELVENRRGRGVRAAAMKSAWEKYSEECPFQPKINRGIGVGVGVVVVVACCPPRG